MKNLFFLILLFGCGTPAPIVTPPPKPVDTVGVHDSLKVYFPRIEPTFKITDSVFLKQFKEACNCSAYFGGLPSDTNGGSHEIYFDTCYCHHYKPLIIYEDTLQP